MYIGFMFNSVFRGTCLQAKILINKGFSFFLKKSDKNGPWTVN